VHGSDGAGAQFLGDGRVVFGSVADARGHKDELALHVIVEVPFGILGDLEVVGLKPFVEPTAGGSRQQGQVVRAFLAPFQNGDAFPGHGRARGGRSGRLHDRLVNFGEAAQLGEGRPFFYFDLGAGLDGNDPGEFAGATRVNDRQKHVLLALTLPEKGALLIQVDGGGGADLGIVAGQSAAALAGQGQAVAGGRQHSQGEQWALH